jgi:hypothetical protein
LCLACLACPEELALPALPFALEGTPALLGPLATGIGHVMIGSSAYRVLYLGVMSD